MKTAGVVFDFYDDPSGSLLKSVFATADALPEQIKEAHILSPEERSVLRDDAFALVAIDEGKMIRKFACVDPGNTILSLLYFDKTAEKLPEEARSATAARLLLHLDSFFGGEEKTAAKGAERKRDPMRQPLVGDEADWAQRTNLVSVRGGVDSGRIGTIMGTLNTKMAAAKPAGFDFGKSVQKTVDWAKPHFANAQKAVKKNPGLTAGAALTGVAAGRMSKEAAARAMQTHWEGTVENDKLEGLHEVVEGLIGRGKMPIDVSGKDAKVQFQEKKASRYALDGRYPLDSYSDIRAAVSYFNDNWAEFDPSERHEFAVKTAAAAEEIGLDLPDLLARYGSTGYAPDVEAHIANRKANSEGRYHEAYDALLEKRAELEPTQFVDLLSQIDAVAGINWYWGGAIADPWFATFGGRSASEKTAFGWEGGGYVVNAEQLQEAAASGVLKGNFTDDIVSAFEKDPVAIFSSMPDDSKAVIARLASEA